MVRLAGSKGCCGGLNNRIPSAMAAVVCHPHPLYQGTMHNKVVYQAAKLLDALTGIPCPAVQLSRRGSERGKLRSRARRRG